MVKLSVDLNEPKDSSKTDKAAQNGRTPKSLTLEIHHGGWFTPTPSRSYIGGQPFFDTKLGLDYGLHSLNVDADVLEMSKYVKDYKIILVYVEHGSSIFVTPKKGVSIAVNNHLRKCHIEIDSSPDPSSSVEAPIVVECAEDPFEELDDLLGEYAHIGKQITINEITGNEITRNESIGNDITGKHMVVHVGKSSTVDNVLELGMLFETEGVGPVGKFKEVEVDADNESEEESDTEGDYTIDSDTEDLDYDPKHDDVFDDDEHIVEEVHVNRNNFRFTADLKHDTSIGGVDVQDDDLDVIDYNSFGSDLDDGTDSERRMQLRKLRRIGKQKNKGPNKYYFYLGQQFASKKIVKGRVKKHSVETRIQLILVKNDNERVRVRCQGTIPALVPYVAIDNNTDKKYRVIKSLATNPDIHVMAVQDQMQKQFEVGVLKMKTFRAKRIASDIMIGSYREQYSLLREYAQELINQNPGTTVRIDVQQEPNPESLTRIFRRVYVCLGALKQGFRACGREILGLDGCFMSGPWPGQILTAVGVDANNGIYPVAYAIVEAESKASWCWFLNLLGEDLGIEANFNYTFISDRQKGLIQAIASVFPSAEHRYCVRHIHENMKSQFKGGVYKEMLWNAAKATSEGEFKKKMGELKSFNSDAYDWLMKIPLEQWSRAHFSVIAKTAGPLTPSVTKMFDAIKKRLLSIMKWELTGILCKHVVVAIYNMSKNSMGVGIPEQWVHAAYRLETWAHVYTFKVNPCNGRDMWPVVESRTIIIPHLYKPLIGRPPKKRKKSNDEIASQSASSCKLSRKVLADSVFGLCLVRSVMFG
ncbi:mutator type transposase [Tanacetum coccineum]|uniref:Mutator type transposase n=1 Tax=Tanacetum coccineum TaxID=301880 RepID=A0ABQ5E206_9ASTR